jgi:hypothetical protein
MAIDRIAWKPADKIARCTNPHSVQAKKNIGVFDGRRRDRRAQEQRREPPSVHRNEILTMIRKS